MIALLILAGTLLTGLLAGAALSFCVSRRENDASHKTFQAELEQIRAEVAFVAQGAQHIPVAPPAPAFNLNRRPDATRRLRAGQPHDLISESTGWSVPEIALLQKIEAITALKREP